MELWSAYAPNFKELDENHEYEEREDEFDIVNGALGMELAVLLHMSELSPVAHTL